MATKGRSEALHVCIVLLELRRCSVWARQGFLILDDDGRDGAHCRWNWNQHGVSTRVSQLLAGRTLGAETRVARSLRCARCNSTSISVSPCFDLTYKNVVVKDTSVILTEHMDGTRGSAPTSRDRTALLLFQAIPAWSEVATKNNFINYGICHRTTSRNFPPRKRSHLRWHYTCADLNPL